MSDLGCPYGQGYFYARPLTPGELEARPDWRLPEPSLGRRHEVDLAPLADLSGA